MIPIGDDLLAVVGIFSSPVEEVLLHAFTNIIVEKTREAFFLEAWLAQGRSGNYIQPLLKCDEDVFIHCVFYFVAQLIDE